MGNNLVRQDVTWAAPQEKRVPKTLMYVSRRRKTLCLHRNLKARPKGKNIQRLVTLSQWISWLIHLHGLNDGKPYTWLNCNKIMMSNTCKDIDYLTAVE
jgi:hypothetical protein